MSSKSPADAARAGIAGPMADACATSPTPRRMPARAAFTSAPMAAAAATAARVLSSEACPGRDPGWTNGSRKENTCKQKDGALGSDSIRTEGCWLFDRVTILHHTWRAERSAFFLLREIVVPAKAGTH